MSRQQRNKTQADLDRVMDGIKELHARANESIAVDHRVQDQARPASANQGLALNNELARYKSWVRELREKIKDKESTIEKLLVDLKDALADVDYFKDELEIAKGPKRWIPNSTIERNRRILAHERTMEANREESGGGEPYTPSPETAKEAFFRRAKFLR